MKHLEKQNTDTTSSLTGNIENISIQCMNSIDIGNVVVVLVWLKVKTLYVWQGEKGEPSIAAQGDKGEPGSPGLPGLMGPKVKATIKSDKRIDTCTCTT